MASKKYELEFDQSSFKTINEPVCAKLVCSEVPSPTSPRTPSNTQSSLQHYELFRSNSFTASPFTLPRTKSEEKLLHDFDDANKRRRNSSSCSNCEYAGHDCGAHGVRVGLDNNNGGWPCSRHHHRRSSVAIKFEDHT